MTPLKAHLSEIVCCDRNLAKPVTLCVCVFVHMLPVKVTTDSASRMKHTGTQLQTKASN